MTTCKQIQTDLSAFIDHELSPTRKAQVEEHLNTCLSCKHQVSELERIAYGTKHLPQANPSTDFLTIVKEKVNNESSQKKATASLVDILFRPIWLKLPLEATALIIILVSVTTLVSPRLQNSEKVLTAKRDLTRDDENIDIGATGATKSDGNRFRQTEQKNNTLFFADKSLNETVESLGDELNKQTIAEQHGSVERESRLQQNASPYANNLSDSSNMRIEKAVEGNQHLQNTRDQPRFDSTLESVPSLNPATTPIEVVTIKSQRPSEIYTQIKEILKPLKGSIREASTKEGLSVLEVHIPKQHLIAFKQSLQPNDASPHRTSENFRSYDNLKSQLTAESHVLEKPAFDDSKVSGNRSKPQEYVLTKDTDNVEKAEAVTNVTAVIQIRIISTTE